MIIPQLLAVSSLAQHVPEALQRQGPRGLLLWQWIALLPLALAAAALGGLLGRVTIACARSLAKRSSFLWDDMMVDALRGPVKLVWALVLLFAAFPLLEPSAAGEAFLHVLLRAASLVAFFW